MKSPKSDLRLSRQGSWLVWYDQDDKERFRCMLPEDVTTEEIERFIEHLKKEVAKQAAGPN